MKQTLKKLPLLLLLLCLFVSLLPLHASAIDYSAFDEETVEAAVYAAFLTAADAIEEGNEVEVDLDRGIIFDKTVGKTYETKPFPEFIQNIIKCGGLLKSLKEGEQNG